MRVSVVIPNWNGARWLPGCLDALAAQTVAPDEVIVVDNGSSDDSLAVLGALAPDARVIARPSNEGFAVAANRGIAAAAGEVVALLNTDVVLAADWLELMLATLAADERLSSVACRMVDLEDPGVLYDAGDVLRRDAAAVQRGRFRRDGPRFGVPGPVFAACAGAAVYRRAAVREVGGFDERFFAYLEDVDLGLRLRLAGWDCRYEPRAVARHAGGGSSHQLREPVAAWVERNTLLIVAKAFPLRWLPLVAYRQLAWAVGAARARRLGVHLRGARAALPLLPAMLRERRALARTAAVPVERAVPRMPIRGPGAAGHPRGVE